MMLIANSAQSTQAGWGTILLLAFTGAVCTFIGMKLKVKKEDCVDPMDEYMRIRLPRISLIGGILCLAAALMGAIRLISKV